MLNIFDLEIMVLSKLLTFRVAKLARVMEQQGFLDKFYFLLCTTAFARYPLLTLRFQKLARFVKEYLRVRHRSCFRHRRNFRSVKAR